MYEYGEIGRAEIGIGLLLVIVVYLITSYPIYRLAKKADYKSPIFAFIPIANIVLMLNIAGKTGWLALLVLVPLVNMIFGIYLAYIFFNSYESGALVFGAILISGLLGLFIPLASLIGTVAIWWLALSNKPFIGNVHGKKEDL